MQTDKNKKKRGDGAKIPSQNKPSEATPETARTFPQPPDIPADNTENGADGSNTEPPETARTDSNFDDNTENGADGSNTEPPEITKKTAPPDAPFFEKPANIVFVGKKEVDENGKTRRVNLPLPSVQNGDQTINLPTMTTQIAKIPFYIERAADVVKMFGDLYKFFKPNKGGNK